MIIKLIVDEKIVIETIDPDFIIKLFGFNSIDEARIKFSNLTDDKIIEVLFLELV